MSKISMTGLCAMLALLLGNMPAQAESPATAPASGATPRMTYQLPMTRTGHFSELGQKVNDGFTTMVHLMLDNRDAMSDSEKRKALLLKLKPVSAQLHDDAVALCKQEGDVDVMKSVVKSVDAKSAEYRLILGDEELMKSLQADIDGPDVSKGMRARVQLIERDWSLAKDAQEQGAVVDALEALDRAHPDSAELAGTTYHLSGLAGQVGRRDLNERLLTVLADVMDKSATAPFEKSLKLVAGHKSTLASIGKPFVLAGKTADGKDFTTADWKGKVVLVDFWATWCGPCKEALPGIQKLYTDQHGNGLEIVSVSNDFKLADLQKYTADHNMPWPQLFNGESAAKKDWNPITLGYGVNSIPRLFVIDRQGILMSADARETFKELVNKALMQ